MSRYTKDCQNTQFFAFLEGRIYGRPSENVSVCDISRLNRAIVSSASNFEEFRNAEISDTSGSDEVSIA